jgi:hypothetical protein
MLTPEQTRRGGIRRAEVLTDKERSEIARSGAAARWEGKTAEERKIERARGRDTKPEKAEIEPNPTAMEASA